MWLCGNTGGSVDYDTAVVDTQYEDVMHRSYLVACDTLQCAPSVARIYTDTHHALILYIYKTSVHAGILYAERHTSIAVLTLYDVTKAAYVERF